MSEVGNEKLRAAVGSVPADLPYSFEQFEQRHTARQLRHGLLRRAAIGAVAALALVLGVALLTQAPVREVPAVASAAVPASAARPIARGASADLPALVNLDQFEHTSELEEQIAMLDAELSAAHVSAASPGTLREMESTRAQLQDSLQRVTYAHSLMRL